MVTTRLFLTGITAEGRHGANLGEKDVAQDFVVDLDVEVDIGRDDLAATADYRELIRIARGTVAERSFELLESIAHAVAAAVLEHEGVTRVSAVVHKPAAARSTRVQGVAAAATLQR
jgi:dihydroneopterin aldolase